MRNENVAKIARNVAVSLRFQSFLPARRCASAVLDMALCPSLRPSQRRYCIKTAEPIIDMPFGGWLTCAGRTNSFAVARGDRTAMRPFVKILWPLVTFYYWPILLHLLLPVLEA